MISVEIFSGSFPGFPNTGSSTPKSLYISRAVSYFYETQFEICAGFRPVCSFKKFCIFAKVSQFWGCFFIQLNEYETDPYFLHFFQSNTTFCLIIHVFCKSCEPEIVLAVLQIKTKTISRSQTLQNAWIIKQTVVLLWKFWRKYWSVSYLFGCMKSIFKFFMKSLFEILRSPIKSIFRRPCWACVVFVQSWKDGKSKQMHHLRRNIERRRTAQVSLLD